MKKYLFVLILVIATVFCACGNVDADNGNGFLPDINLPEITKKDDPKEARTAEQIAEDIEKSGFYQDYYSDFDITSAEIIKRQTDVDNKLDKIWITVNCRSFDESAEGYVKLIAEYGLYNEGWIFDGCDFYEDDDNPAQFKPLKGPEITEEEIIGYIPYAYGSITDLVLNGHETDLENGTDYVTASFTDTHKYVVYNQTLRVDFDFNPYNGQWNFREGWPDIIEHDEQWCIADEFDNPDSRDNLIISINGSVDSLSVAYNDTWSDYYSDISDIHIYRVSNATPLEEVMGDFFEKVNWNYAEYITYYDFSIKMQGDFSYYYDFEYVAWWDGGGNRCDGMLFIGHDELGYLWGDDYEIDQYNRRVIVDTSELTPLLTVKEIRNQVLLAIEECLDDPSLIENTRLLLNEYKDTLVKLKGSDFEDCHYIENICEGLAAYDFLWALDDSWDYVEYIYDEDILELCLSQEGSPAYSWKTEFCRKLVAAYIVCEEYDPTIGGISEYPEYEVEMFPWLIEYCEKMILAYNKILS